MMQDNEMLARLDSVEQDTGNLLEILRANGTHAGIVPRSFEKKFNSQTSPLRGQLRAVDRSPFS